jgi:hypothetical protein
MPSPPRDVEGEGAVSENDWAGSVRSRKRTVVGVVGAQTATYNEEMDVYRSTRSEEDSLENIWYVCACMQHAGGVARGYPASRRENK